MAIIDEMAQLDTGAEKKRLEAINLEQEKTDELQELESQATEKMDYYDKRIKHVNAEADLLDKSKEKRKAALIQKLAELDKAMIALNEISKLAGQQEDK
jgi:hypothetical protein